MTTLHRIFVLLFILIVGSELHGQNTSSQNATYIAELETAHSPLSNTFVSVSMKRPTHIIPEGEQILIHRSTDHTATWLLVDSFLPAANCRLIDPVITIDAVGNFYIVFMRIEHASAPLEQRVTHLDLYRSIDDGQSWHFVSSPYTHILPDYPQIIARGEGKLFLAFGNPLSNSEQHIVFMNSVDSGNTWSNPHIFEYPSTQASQVGIPDLAWGKDSIIHLSFGSSLYKGPCHVQSVDFGLSWSGFTFANQGSTAAQSSVLSKVIGNPQVDFFTILSHRPHYNSVPITCHYKDGSQLGTTYIGDGAYAEGLITEDSILHVIYNELNHDTFRIKYLASKDQGKTFSYPYVLYSGPFQVGERGEYQSLLQGDDGRLYLTFCDWADSSIAKTIIFPPHTHNTVQTPEPIDAFEDQYRVFPNPCKGRIHIENCSGSFIQEIHFTSLQGKLEKVLPIYTKQRRFDVDLSSLPSGTYLLRIKENQRYIIRKIVKVN